MPIKIVEGLSARKQLEEEGINLIDDKRASHQDIRPLRILVLNLMPLKKPTEIQLLRLIGDSAIQCEVDFAHTITHEARNTDASYLEKNYLSFDEIKDEYYDGMLVTGAPVETHEFEDVDYWHEFTTYLEWAKSHVFSVLHFCWGAQAGLYYYYGIKKKLLPAKLFGIYPYDLTVKHHQLLRGFDDRYFIPQSRHTSIDDEAVNTNPFLIVLSRSQEHGNNIITTRDMRRIFILGHFEYDRRTLEQEYIRDRNKGMDIAVPENYYPDDDPTQKPRFIWCSYAHLFYHNWINMVYQETPYDLTTLSRKND